MTSVNKKVNDTPIAPKWYAAHKPLSIPSGKAKVSHKKTFIDEPDEEHSYGTYNQAPTNASLRTQQIDANSSETYTATNTCKYTHTHIYIKYVCVSRYTLCINAAIEIWQMSFQCLRSTEQIR